jgi:ubiquinone/menaquinone biosynthesis C-methylase UbiE
MASHFAGETSPKIVLDLGTGTGIASRELREVMSPGSIICGVDVSREMLLEARRSGLGLLAVADALQLPFAKESFDLVIASFVLSHLQDTDAAMREVLRVLRPGGCFAATSWLGKSSPSRIETDWRSVAITYLSEDLLDKAQTAVVPAEERFGESENLRDGFGRCGFSNVEVMSYADKHEVSLSDYIAERAAYSGGRFMRATLPPYRWREFLSEVADYLRKRHPPVVSLENGFLLAIGSKP